jgi:DNA-binding NarL/FixJ family response regulator
MTEDDPEIRVLIVDDHRMFADSLARLLNDEPDLEVVEVATTGTAGVALAAALQPSVALVDYNLPDMNGVALTAKIRQETPHTYVVMLTGAPSDGVLLNAIEAGCSGYLSKDRAALEVVEAVRLAAAGEALISPRELARLLPRLGRAQRSVGSDLTDREREVLALLAEGAANPHIASTLFLSVNTVRNYVQSILTKLGAHSKLEAVSIAVREGVIDYPTGSN